MNSAFIEKIHAIGRRGTIIEINTRCVERTILLHVGRRSRVRSTTVNGTEYVFKSYNMLQLEDKHYHSILNEMRVSEQIALRLGHFMDLFCIIIGYSIECNYIHLCMRRRQTNLYKVVNRAGGLQDMDMINGIKFRIITAMELLHSIDIVHMDIKSENILCDNDGGSCCLSDFEGAVMDYRMKTTNIRFITTKTFAPPEYFEPSVRQSGYSMDKYDIFQLGILLIDIIHPGLIDMEHMHVGPRSYYERISDISDAYLMGQKQFILKCIDPIPARRMVLGR